MKKVLSIIYITFILTFKLSASSEVLDETEKLIKEVEEVLQESDELIKNPVFQKDHNDSNILPITIFSVTLVLSIIYYFYLRLFKGRNPLETREDN